MQRTWMRRFGVLTTIFFLSTTPQRNAHRHGPVGAGLVSIADVVGNVVTVGKKQ